MIERANVPCNGCKLCCQHDLIVLHPENGDVVADYAGDTERRINPLTGVLVHALKRKPNGNCVYLGPDGCTIHDRAPVVCREFDCRLMYLCIPRAERRRLVRQGLMEQAVFDAGRARLESLSQEERAHADQRRKHAGSTAGADAAAVDGADGSSTASADAATR